MTELGDRLREEFQDKEYRHAYADEFLNSSIATQVKVLREQRRWTQEELASDVGMKQSRISLLENVHYSAWSLNTLKRLAQAFDTTLKVSFETFGARLTDMERFGRESLERFSFDEDPMFQGISEEQVLPSQEIIASRKTIEGQKPQESNLYNVFCLEFYRSLKLKEGAFAEHQIPKGQLSLSPPLRSSHTSRQDAQTAPPLASGQ